MSREERRERREARRAGHNDDDLIPRNVDRQADVGDDRLIQPRPEPGEEPVDRHDTIPLDNDDDVRWLRPDDPRRLEIELRRGGT